MGDVSVKCVFCGQETCEKIIKFTPKTLQKCMTILEYRKVKPVRRESRNAYATVEISDETSLNDGYHAQCYKLFTALKIPSDFRRQGNEITPKSAQECDDAPELAEESPELSIAGTSTTTQAAGTTIDEAGPSNIAEPDLEDCDDQFDAGEPVNKEDLLLRECCICEKSRKRRHGRDMPLAVNKLRTLKLLKSAATEHNDIEMLEKISSFSDSSEIPYHKCCKDLYLRELHKKDEKDFVKKRKASNTAYDLLCEILKRSNEVKTSKHITLGLAVKSLCNNKKIIDLLSKYEHCCSYTTLEELETE